MIGERWEFGRIGPNRGELRYGNAGLSFDLSALPTLRALLAESSFDPWVEDAETGGAWCNAGAVHLTMRPLYGRSWEWFVPSPGPIHETDLLPLVEALLHAQKRASGDG